MKYLTLLVFTFLISLSSGLRAQLYYPSFDKMSSVTEARADIEFIKNTLEKEHPNLYLYIDQEGFNKKIDSLKRSINKPITQVALKNAILGVLTLIGNGHLSLLININDAEARATRQVNLKTYPIEQFKYLVLQGRLFISGTSEPNALIPRGAEIFSPNFMVLKKAFYSK